MHSQKTKQPYIRSTRKNRTRRKKSAVEEDPHTQKTNKKIKKNESFEQMKSAESLKREKPQNKPKRRTKYIKTALQIAKNGIPKDTKGKEQALAQKTNKRVDPTTP